MTADLSVELAGLLLPSPADDRGRLRRTAELASYTDLARSGPSSPARSRSTRRPARTPPRIVETPSGVLSAAGHQNPGLQGFLATELPWLAQQGVRVVVSISAASLAEYGELARRVATAPA